MAARFAARLRALCSIYYQFEEHFSHDDWRLLVAASAHDALRAHSDALLAIFRVILAFHAPSHVSFTAREMAPLHAASALYGADDDDDDDDALDETAVLLRIDAHALAREPCGFCAPEKKCALHERTAENALAIEAARRTVCAYELHYICTPQFNITRTMREVGEARILALRAASADVETGGESEAEVEPASSPPRAHKRARRDHHWTIGGKSVRAHAWSAS